MKKIQKTITIYDFNELDEELQKELIEKQAETEAGWFCDFELEQLMNEAAEHLLYNVFGEDNGIENIAVYYDFSYSQGSGACFTCDIPLETVNKKLKIFTEKEQKIFENYGSIINIKHCGGSYYHEYSTASDFINLDYSIDYAFYNEEITENKKQKMEEKLEKLEKELEKLIVYINTELKKSGYSMIEDQEFFEERAKNDLMEFEYFEDGTKTETINFL